MLQNLVVALCLLVLGCCVSPVLADSAVQLQSPPAALEEWYKPANKRQVWLHTMFRLRREMQAIVQYAEQNDRRGMEKWVARLEKDYDKIADMVPAWKAETRPRLMSELRKFAKKGDMVRVEKTMKMIQRTCDDCHRDYQPLVTAIYRSPDYHDIQLKDLQGEVQGFPENMEALSKSVNRVLIALDDGHDPVALQAGRDLAGQLQNLGESCAACHQDDAYPRERILGQATRERLEALQADISAGRKKESQELMGEIAVTVCARCHNTHRIVYDLRNALVPAE